MIIFEEKDGWLHKVPLTFLGLCGVNFNELSKNIIRKLQTFMVVPNSCMCVTMGCKKTA